MDTKRKQSYVMALFKESRMNFESSITFLKFIIELLKLN